MTFTPVAELAVDPATCRIYAEGWQSWSPTRVHRLGEAVPFPTDPRCVALGYRADSPPGRHPQGEGLFVVDTGSASHVFSGPGLPSIRGVADGSTLRVEATGPVRVDSTPQPLEPALADWGSAQAPGQLRPAPTVWCSWYHYFTNVTAQDVYENLAAVEEFDLPIDVIQLDDGYQAEIGDWLILSDRFRSLAEVAGRIRDAGRRAGIWVAPFLVGERSELARRHSDWLVPGAWAGRNWDQELGALDLSVPAAAQYLTDVFGALHAAGFDYFKIDFCYAGALADLDAYREGLTLIREAIGDSYLLACGAPTLASVGYVDAMRVSPDIATHYETTDGDLSQPGQRSAVGNGRARGWQHGRLWVNDSDCLIARPGVERREEWADHVERYGGLRSSSDRLRSLDTWGLATTRRLLGNVPPPEPFG